LQIIVDKDYAYHRLYAIYNVSGHYPIFSNQYFFFSKKYLLWFLWWEILPLVVLTSQRGGTGYDLIALSPNSSVVDRLIALARARYLSGSNVVSTKTTTSSLPIS
jgi:hypothetical protein